MRLAVCIAALILVWLQFTLWFGQSGHFAQARLESQLKSREAKVEALAERNVKLTAQVLALKSDKRFFESQARESLGMIRAGETLYLVPDDR